MTETVAPLLPNSIFSATKTVVCSSSEKAIRSSQVSHRYRAALEPLYAGLCRGRKAVRGLTPAEGIVAFLAQMRATHAAPFSGSNATIFVSFGGRISQNFSASLLVTAL